MIPLLFLLSARFKKLSAMLIRNRVTYMVKFCLNFNHSKCSVGNCVPSIWLNRNLKYTNKNKFARVEF